MDEGRLVWAEVDLAALKRNYARIQSYTKSEIMPIVKADAYGHGVLPVVKTLRQLGVKRFGVAHIEEAIEIKSSFPGLTLMVIGYTSESDYPLLIANDVIPCIYGFEQAQALSKAAVAAGKKVKLHVKVDTGMGRIGLKTDEKDEILKMAQLPMLEIEGVFSHLAVADQLDLTYTREQLQKFNDLIAALQAEGLTIPVRHIANSAAILQLTEAHFELVRPGIILYGLPPSSQVGKNAGFEPVMSWKARITHIKMIQAGETVSYGRTFRAAYPTRVATIPVGYADGLRRTLSNHGEILVNGNRASIIGRVCMDQTMLDITKIPDVHTGDVVTILGCDGSERIDATEMAGWLGTINYEIVCGISKRVPRVYLNQEDRCDLPKSGHGPG